MNIARIARLEETAYHEAGHVVAAFELGISVRRVTIAPGNGYLGQVCHWDSPAFDPGADLSLRTRARLEAMILVRLAGAEAHRKLRGNLRGSGRDHDLSSAADLALYVGGDGEGATAYLRWVSFQARRFFNPPHRWEAVQRVARALLAEGTLTGKEARAACLVS